MRRLRTGRSPTRGAGPAVAVCDIRQPPASAAGRVTSELVDLVGEGRFIRAVPRSSSLLSLRPCRGDQCGISARWRSISRSTG